MDNSDFNKTSQKDLVSTSFKFQSLICSACCNYFDRKEQSIITASPGDKRHCLPILRSSFGYQLSPVCQRPVVQVFNWDRKQSKCLIICGILESINSSCSTFCFISCLHPKKTPVYQLLSFALETWMFESRLKKEKKIINIPLSTRVIWAVHLKNCVEMSETVVGWVRLIISNV